MAGHARPLRIVVVRRASDSVGAQPVGERDCAQQLADIVAADDREHIHYVQRARAASLLESRLMRKVAVLLAVLGTAGAGLCARQPVRARHGMVATREAHATDIGVAVLESGGNAIDAAVAVGFALAVTHPAAGNIGGGGFLLARFADGRTTFIDFRERIPAQPALA